MPRTASARFHTRSGVLSAESDGDWIVLDFPSTPPEEATAPEGIVDALGCKVAWTGRSRFDVFLVVDEAETVRELEPDMARLATADARGSSSPPRPATPGGWILSPGSSRRAWECRRIR